MANMKIENYEGTADTFTFPNNPSSVDRSGISSVGIKETANAPFPVITSNGSVRPKSIILSGHVSGSSKESDMRAINKHFLLETNQLKKLYWEDNRFMLGVGVDCKSINTGGRIGFIDYVCGFKQIVPVVFGDVLHTTVSNGGDAPTYVEEITCTYDGSGDVVFTDVEGRNFEISSSQLSSSDVITYTFVKMNDSGSGVMLTEYAIFEINGVVTKAVNSVGGYGALQIPSGGDNTDVSITNVTGVTTKYRDAYSL
jgi:hypothetical protein